MATFDVEVISKDIIKPSTPTPKHLKKLRFSSIDQLAPSIHMPGIWFYNNPPLHQQLPFSSLLKTSLSETLVQFYPLAGRINSGSFVDCNDEGVEFYEAHVSTTLSEVVDNPNPDELIKLLAFAPVVNSNKLSVVTGIQLNHFLCGGVAISVSISHKISDAKTVVDFVDTWATNARHHHYQPRLPRGETSPRGRVDNEFGGRFMSASIFPPKENQEGFQIMNNGSGTTTLLSDEKLVTKRLIFNKEHINALKKQSLKGTPLAPKWDKGSTTLPTPSRSLVVCGFIWKRFIEAARAKRYPPKIFGGRQIINLRTISPSSPSTLNCLGNMYAAKVASYYLNDQEPEDEYAQLISKLKESIKKADIKFFEKLQNGENIQVLPKEYYENIRNVEICGFSSCVWFPFYEVNFGWDKPVWVSLTSLPEKNTVILMPTKCGQGIEAWVNLHQDYASLFEHNSCVLN